MSMNFNTESEKPTFMYKHNPLAPHSWQIFALKEGKADYEPVGDYTVLDLDEDADLTEKKMMNLIAILNGRREVQQLGALTKTRTFFTLIPEKDGDLNKKLIFRTYTGDGISKENAILVIEKGVFKDDSSKLSIHDLRHILEGNFGSRLDNALTISVISFGFRSGLPREADIVMDVRFLRNPHWDEKLKPKTGLDKNVGKYIEEDPEFEEFMQNLQSLLKPLIPRYCAEGKHYLTIALGCTGGKHRSVYCAEILGEWLKQNNHPAHIEHRDLKD